MPHPDRDYWRGQPEQRLIEEARDSGHELCIALGERLDGLRDTDRSATGPLRREIDALEEQVEEIRDEIFALQVDKSLAEDEADSAYQLLTAIELAIVKNAAQVGSIFDALLPDISKWLNQYTGEDADG
jgi:hypothetical protein